ncbi:MAG: hypothetical protein FWC16_12050 [Defluviitaleaceae bacterium]|nr:hypothetical protein [Defluviitaleaceae bacterium]MCL2275651.1 hypothetical protein [Defluviitaleaceae bacterium]
MISATTIWGNFTTRNYRIEKPTAPSLQREKFITARQIPPNAPATQANRSIHPLQQNTRIDSYNIPVETPPNKPWYAWLETLRPEVRDLIYSHPDDFLRTQLANLSEEGRAQMVAQVEDFIVFEAKMLPIHERLTALAESMGMELALFSVDFEPPQLILAAFRCPNGGEDKFVSILADGTKLFTNLPPGFADKHGNNFMNEIINDLLQQREGINQSFSPNTRLREFFEQRFATAFPEHEQGIL